MRENEWMNQLYFTRVVEKTRGLFSSSPRKRGKLLLTEYPYIDTNHVTKDTRQREREWREREEGDREMTEEREANGDRERECI